MTVTAPPVRMSAPRLAGAVMPVAASGALVLALRAPLATTVLGLIFFGVLHNVLEIRYVAGRFASVLRGEFLLLLVALISGIVVCRAVAFAAPGARVGAGYAEIVLGLALRRAGRGTVLRVAEYADGRSESVLESMLRSILIDAGLDAGFEPQVVIEDDEFDARVDLGHQDLRLVVEADSFEFHGTRKALVADCRRYVSLVVRGWTVLRFSWEDVMYDPDWVVECVRACVSGHTSGHNSILRAA